MDTVFSRIPSPDDLFPTDPQPLPHRPMRRISAEAPARICVVGVGGGGCNAIIRMMKTKNIPGVNYIGVNTDIKSLNQVEEAEVLQIGGDLTRGLGAGGIPTVGAQAAEEDRQVLEHALQSPDLVFLAAGMGGGTGTGAAPVVADIARESGALVVAVVTTPFSFEGSRRKETALLGVAGLRDKVDNIIVIHNDRLLHLFGDEDVSMDEALRRADDAVMLGVLSVAELVNVPGEINVDLADVKSIMKRPGRALMAIGEGHGPGGAMEAAEQAVNNPLLDLAIDGAQGVLFNVSGGSELKLSAVNQTGEFIASRVDQEAMIFFGMGNDPSFQDKVRITLIATGIPSDDHRVTRDLDDALRITSGAPGAPDLDLPPFLRRAELFRRKF